MAAIQRRKELEIAIGRIMNSEKLIIEVMYKGRASVPCAYMEEAVCDILPECAGKIEYRRADLQGPAGKKRFLELSCKLFGEEAVWKYHKLAPIPSLFINGDLIFDAIPPRDELLEAIEAYLDNN